MVAQSYNFNNVRSKNNDGDACKENEPNLFEIKDKLVEIN